MLTALMESRSITTPTPGMIEAQLTLLVKCPALRSSKRLVSFLEYVVRETLAGFADQLKERSIGVEVFDRDPDYDTSNDHIVRTAASELRKRLAVYYDDDAHREQLRIDIPVGSYVPVFTVPNRGHSTETIVVPAPAPLHEAAALGIALQETRGLPNRYWLVVAALSTIGAALLVFAVTRVKETSQSMFWHPLVGENKSALLVMGEVPQGQAELDPGAMADSPPSSRITTRGLPVVDLGDAMSMSRLTTMLAEKGKPVMLRSGNATSFSDLQNGPSILLGAFNNDWSLRFSRPLRFSFAMDSDRNLLYIRDRLDPSNRSWSVIAMNQPPYDSRRSSGKPVIDYALISRIVNSETGEPMVIIGGLYVYGTEAASALMTDPQFENQIASLPLRHSSKVLQIIVQTNVTEGIPGPPKIVTFWEE